MSDPRAGIESFFNEIRWRTDEYYRRWDEATIGNPTMSDWADKANELLMTAVVDGLTEKLVTAALRSAHITGLREARELIAEAPYMVGRIEKAIDARIAELEKEAKP